MLVVNVSPQESPFRVTTHLVCSLVNEQQFIDNRQFLALSLQFGLKLLNLHSQALRTKEQGFWRAQDPNPRWRSCITKNNYEENPISQLLPLSSWVKEWLVPGLITGELVYPIPSTRTADILRLLMVPTAPGLSEDSEVHPTEYFANRTKICTGGVKKISLTLAGDQFTNSSMRFNYPFHYLSLHSSECEPSMNQRNSR